MNVHGKKLLMLALMVGGCGSKGKQDQHHAGAPQALTQEQELLSDGSFETGTSGFVVSETTNSSVTPHTTAPIAGAASLEAYLHSWGTRVYFEKKYPWNQGALASGLRLRGVVRVDQGLSGSQLKVCPVVYYQDSTKPVEVCRDLDAGERAAVAVDVTTATEPARQINRVYYLVRLNGAGPARVVIDNASLALVTGDAGNQGGAGGGGAGGGSTGAGGGGGNASSQVQVHLVPQAGVAGNTRVNFAVPLPPNIMTTEALAVFHGATEVASARRILARYPDGSARSVQVQIDLPLAGETDVEVRLGQAPTLPALSLVAVESLLVAADGKSGPKVWGVLPEGWLAASGVAGPLLPQGADEGAAAGAWDNVCNYGRHDYDAFVSQQTSSGAWLYDRATAMYRGYARRGELAILQSAYKEAAHYRASLTGTGAATRIGVPGRITDVKYHYVQGMAIHYLLTGDDRFREAAEGVAQRINGLSWKPTYDGDDQHWTERNAGFLLLGYVWAAIVSDDQSATFSTWADQAADAILAVQATYPAGYTDANARCFAHSGVAHDPEENLPGFGCSPWMSAILADALDAYSRLRGGSDAEEARQAIVKLGRIIARDGRDADGKPFYWLAFGNAQDQVDPFDEHWGESAYVVAMAWHHQGRTEAGLKTAAEALLAGLKAEGSAPHLRSFNWQCRSAVATSYFLR